jgi:hypothetical protein
MVSSNITNIFLKAALFLAAVSCSTTKTEPSPEPVAVIGTTIVPKRDPVAPIEKTYIDAIMNHTIIQDQALDPSIQLVKSTDLGKNFSTMIFNDIPGKPPYRLEERRMAQEDPSKFYTAVDAEKTLNTVRQLDMPFGILMLENAYLPGERITWRISSQDGTILKEAICCPNPLVIKHEDGRRRIIEASLLSIHHPETVYMLIFPPSDQDREYIFTSGTQESRGVIPAGKGEATTFAPGIPGLTGGIARIEIKVSSKSHILDLPWGSKFKTNPSMEGMETSYMLDGDTIKNVNKH